MSNVLTDDVARFVRATGPDPDEVLLEMDEYAESEGFPHVGPEVGGFLRLMARLTDARRIYEFGSGYGYSAYWFAEALPTDGEIVLTDLDEDLLDRARTYLERGGFADLAQYESGDALDVIESYEGPFDVVLIDHQKHRYVEAFEAVRSKVPAGGVIVADNAMRADPVQFDPLLEMVEARANARRSSDDTAASHENRDANCNGENRVAVDEHTRGIADYLETVRVDPSFETVVLPLGQGIAVSYRIE